jgi:predicted transcriptional regulator
MAKEKLTIRIQPETRKALDAIARSIDLDRTYVVNDALAAYVETWQTEQIGRGLREAEAGKFVGTKDVKKVLARLRSR